MAGCGRQYCAACGQETIHRDRRKAYESASALGQMVGRRGPVNLSAMDLDLATRKGLMTKLQLLRLLEQKQPEHSMRAPQEQTLRLLDAAIGHCSTCAGAKELRLDPRSGVYLVIGNIVGSNFGRRETGFDGPQLIRRLRTNEEVRIVTEEAFFRFLDLEDPRRRHGIGWKRGTAA